MDLRDELADGSLEQKGGRDRRRRHKSGSKTPPHDLKTHDAAQILVDVHGSGCGLCDGEEDFPSGAGLWSFGEEADEVWFWRE
ncbi:hypothetical protein M0R45_025751 [Rubus argutus]|uniref:Uncharacterized protein n=1 Tax=Rubus argutus TaxID=59490 RepID=A0AAW1WVN6_RUBAR